MSYGAVQSSRSSRLAFKSIAVFCCVLTMYLLTSLIALLSTSVVLAEAAVSNPHHKAAKYVKRSTPPVHTKDAPRKRDTSIFLTNSTSSEYFTILTRIPLNIFQNLLSMDPHCQKSTSILASLILVFFQSLQTWAIPTSCSSGSSRLQILSPRMRSQFGWMEDQDAALWMASSRRMVRDSLQDMYFLLIIQVRFCGNLEPTLQFRIHIVG